MKAKALLLLLALALLLGACAKPHSTTVESPKLLWDKEGRAFVSMTTRDADWRAQERLVRLPDADLPRFKARPKPTTLQRPVL